MLRACAGLAESTSRLASCGGFAAVSQCVELIWSVVLGQVLGIARRTTRIWEGLKKEEKEDNFLDNSMLN